MENWLGHLTVLDLSDSIAGPFCTKLLGQLGAEVIKIEPPGLGDPTRARSPFYQDRPHKEGSGLFLYLNTGKKSVTLNVHTSPGVRMVKELIEDADVLVESFEPGIMEELGLSYEALADTNPGLVMTSITNFGQDGPYKDYKANELVEYALSGLMYPTGFPDREPIQSGGFLPQYKSGLVAAVGTLAALQWRDLSGAGQHLDVSIHEVAANFLETTPILYSYQGILRGRTGSTLTPPTPMCDMYQCKDGHIIITILTQQQMASLYELMGHPEFIDDPRYSNPRMSTGEAKGLLADAIASWFRTLGADEAFKLCQVWRVPSAKVMSSQDLVEDQHLMERGYFQSIDHPSTGPLCYPGAGFRTSQTRVNLQRAPQLGESNYEVYHQRLGYSPNELERLGAMGVI